MRYVLITSAKNEEALIQKTLDSVVAQTLLPERWIIVDDGSTDRTLKIVQSYASRFPWIEFVRQPQLGERSFASKAHAVNAAFDRVRARQFDVVGNVDADVSFDSDYMEFLMEKFSEDQKLGVAGTPFIENDGYDSAKDSFEGENYVAGPCQLFRYWCFQDIGGYVANRHGAIDWIAVMSARMKGWETRSFPEKRYHHHRRCGVAGRSTFVGSFSYGEKDYYIGNSPLWQFFRVAYRVTKPPVLIDGLGILLGYCWAAVRRRERPISPELIRFHRREQMKKLRAILGSLIRFKKVDSFRLDSERNQQSAISNQQSEISRPPSVLSHPAAASPACQPKYVLITPAKNEERFITKTLDSMVAQTWPPERWVIVDDGSTDRTAEIVEDYAKRYRWIELIRRPLRTERHFAGKVDAFNAGLKQVVSLPFDVIGNVDGDLSFEPDYLEFLVRKFSEDPELGVAGTPFTEADDYDSARDSFEGESHVAGGCQLFRRQCFEEIGGYIPNPAGGIDWIAVTTARMKGWRTKSFRDKRFHHYRTLGTAGRGGAAARFSYGEKDYYLGGSPLWQLFRAAYRTTKRPIDGLALLAGYCWAALRRIERPVSSELIRFHRREQMKKLQAILGSLLKLKKIDSFRLTTEQK